MTKKQLFEYAVLHHKKISDDNFETVVIIEPTTKLAKDERSLGMVVARELPADLLDDLDNVDILIRSF